MSDEEEIILSELSDDELVLQMHDDLYDGLKEEIVEGVEILLERGWIPYDVLTKSQSWVKTSVTEFCLCLKCCLQQTQ
jgi:methanogenic corrinoid protein MtbC1